MSILASFSPLVEPISIDEAFVDMTGSRRLCGAPCEIAGAIKKRIKTEVGLTCSVGVAPNKFLAKIASDMDKPDGLFIIKPDRVLDFIDELNIEQVSGVGRRSAKILSDLGIRKLGQVRQFPLDLLEARLGKFGYRLMELAYGRDDSPVTPVHKAKSVSSETTLPRDTTDRDVLASCLLAQSQSVARQLRHLRVGARTITLKIKTADFQRHTRSRTLSHPVQDSETIYQKALELLSVFALKRPIRLIGVGGGSLQPDDAPCQKGLFPEETAQDYRKWEKVDRALDAIGHRYGRGMIKRGTLTVEKAVSRGS